MNVSVPAAPGIEIGFARTGDEIAATFDVMHQLRPNLAREHYVPQVQSLMREEGFSLVALCDHGVVRAVAGFRVITMLYRGRILYVDDLVTDADSRSRGHGRGLLDWLKVEAARRSCREIQLISRNFRTDAHRFYERHGFQNDCRHLSFAIAGDPAQV